MNRFYTYLYPNKLYNIVWHIFFLLITICQLGLSNTRIGFEKQLNSISDPLLKVELIRHYTDSLLWNEFYDDDDVLGYLDSIISICKTEDCGEAAVWAKAGQIDYNLNTGDIQGAIPELQKLLRDPAIQSSYLKAYIHQLMGMCFLMTGHSANEFNHFLEGVNILEADAEDERQLGMLYYYTAILYNYKSLADSCLHYGNKAMDHFKSRGDTIKMVLTNLAFNNWYLTVGDSENSIKCILEAKELSQQFKLRDALHFDILVAMGLAYEKRKEHKKAIEMAEEGVGLIAQGTRMNAQNIALKLWNFYLIIGRSYLHIGRKKEGLVYIEKSIAVCVENDLYPSLVLISELFEVQAQLELQNFERADYILKDFLQGAANNPSYEIYNIKIVKLLTKLYKGSKTKPTEAELTIIKKIIERIIDKNQGKYNTNMLAAYELTALLQLHENRIDEAIVSYDKINELKDSIWSLKKTEAVDKLLIAYQSKGQKQEIAIQNERLKEGDVQRNLLIGLSITFFLLASVLYLFFRQRKQHVYELEQKVRKRTTDLQLANKELEDINEELERFAYITSHDLKEPLRNIISFIGLLERKNLGNDPDVFSYFGYIKESSRHMSQLIKDVLAFSILKKTKIVKKEIAVKHTIEKVQYGISQLIKEKQVQFKMSTLPNVKTDGSMLYLVFKNLIENALKYNKNNQPIIEIEHQKEGKFHWFIVRDNGIGIETEYFDQIFEMFKRLHSKREYAGTGIGLAVCKRIVKYLGGEIKVESTIGEGATFKFSIPV